MNHDLLKSKINEYLCKGSSKEPKLSLVESTYSRNTFFGGFSDDKNSIAVGARECRSLTK